MNKPNNNHLSLSEAPEPVQIAVDLIQLLEENHIATNVALEALQIVVNDFKKKQTLAK